jgi:hypothetical protein
MTMILGANLSDRIYLSSDTRLTVKKESEEIVFYDNILKTIPLNRDIIVSVAGSLDLAKFIFKEIKKRFNNSNIKELKDEIKEFINSLSVDIFTKFSGKSLCMMFGGRNPGHNKKIDGKKIIKMVKQYGDITGKQMNMKKVIFNGLFKQPSVPNPYPELPTVECDLFSIAVSGNGIDITQTEWGDMLAFGADGVSKDDIPEEAFGELEFRGDAGDIRKDFVMLTAIMSDMIKTKKNFKIGGSIFSMFINDEHHGTATTRVESYNLNGENRKFENKIIIQGNKVYSKNEKGVLTKLIYFTEYDVKHGSNSLIL